MRSDAPLERAFVNSREGRGEPVWTRWDYVRDRLVSSPHHYFSLTNVSCRSDDTKERRQCTVLEALQVILNIDTTRETQEESLGWSGRILGHTVIPESQRQRAKDPFLGIGLIL